MDHWREYVQRNRERAATARLVQWWRQVAVLPLEQTVTTPQASPTDSAITRWTSGEVAPRRSTNRSAAEIRRNIEMCYPELTDLQVELRVCQQQRLDESTKRPSACHAALHILAQRGPIGDLGMWGGGWVKMTTRELAGTPRCTCDMRSGSPCTTSSTGLWTHAVLQLPQVGTRLCRGWNGYTGHGCPRCGQYLLAVLFQLVDVSELGP
jgi:hypothetical protein